ncbi:Zinc finger protein 37 [Eufriesea mexicana]|nr:Zinc finger protein 37 [Eufriesea mexicana]
MTKEERNFVILNNFESTNIHYNTAIKQYVSMLNKTSRTIPNILKSSSRSHRFSKTDVTKLNYSLKDVTNTEHVPVLFVPNTVPEHTFNENTLVKKQTEHKQVSRRRKQEFSFVDIWHDLPNWSICSFVDDKKKMSDKDFCISTKLENSAQKKKLKRYIKKQNKKQAIPVLKNEEDHLSSMSQNDWTSECQLFPFLQEIESNDLQDTIDFSSNEIFNKFNYEIYNNNNSDCFTWYVMNSDKICNSLNTKHNSNNCEECDINDNEVDTCETAVQWSLIDNEQIEKDSLTRKSVMFSEYPSETLSLFSDKKSKCSSNSCCDYCFDDCVSNWIATSGTSAFAKNKVLTETFNEVSQTELNSSHLDISKYNTYLSNDASLSETESCFQIINDTNASLTESYENGEDIEEEMFKQSTYMKQQDEYSIPMEDLYVTGTEQIEDNDEHNTNKNEFQCLLCPLTFSNTRTMAMHQTAAHGGMYIILCESCGRLFNRKYHFNRHLIHCRRVNDPFECNMCMRKYRHKSSLIHHLKVAHHVRHNRNCSTTFTCSVCNKSYRKFGAYKNHVKKHTW